MSRLNSKSGSTIMVETVPKLLQTESLINEKLDEYELNIVTTIPDANNQTR